MYQNNEGNLEDIRVTLLKDSQTTNPVIDKLFDEVEQGVCSNIDDIEFLKGGLV